MDNQHSQNHPEAPRADRVASEVRDDGTIIEMAYDPARRETSFVVSQNGQWQFAPSLDGGEHRRIVPFSPQNNLIRSGALLLPSAPEEYGSEQELVRDIQEYIRRYVDLTPAFERLASYYVLMSWVYDDFNEVPYLRVRGDYGTGKTRFLLVVGALCYRTAVARGRPGSGWCGISREGWRRMAPCRPSSTTAERPADSPSEGADDHGQ
jgi:hypothetical protein